MTNLFDKATESRRIAQSKSKSGQVARRGKIKLPVFQGNYRSEKSGTYALDLKSVKVKGKKQKKITVSGKNLTGAFIISYYSCLAACIANSENDYRKAHNFLSDSFLSDKKELVPFTTYLIEAVINQEGYSLSEYAQGTVKGAKRIEAHLLAINKRESTSFVIKNDIISGFTPNLINDVLNAV